MNIHEGQPGKLVGPDAPSASVDKKIEEAMEKTQQKAQLSKPGLPGATKLERNWAAGIKQGVNKLSQ